jgi:hypothetical protein
MFGYVRVYRCINRCTNIAFTMKHRSPLYKDLLSKGLTRYPLDLVSHGEPVPGVIASLAQIQLPVEKFPNLCTVICVLNTQAINRPCTGIAQ